MKKNIKKLQNSVIEIEAEIEAENFEKYFDQAFRKLGENFEMDGFRKGKVPENILLKNIPEIKILEEMASMALNEKYPEILTEEKIDAIGNPEITITKLARGNPLGFKIKTAIIPEIKLPDYKKLAKEVNESYLKNKKDIEVSDQELDNTILDIRKSRAPKKHLTETEGIETNQELPPFDDEYVKSLGPFENVADFKTKLKENIKLEKENLEREKNRLQLIEKIIEKSDIELPEILIESELGKIIYKMESDISQMGLKFEDYLKHLNKTKEDLKKDFRGDAEKKSKLSLVLNEIAKLEKLEANKEEIEKEVAHLLEHYKDADPNRARIHAENVLTNEKVFNFLENQK